MNLHDLSPMEGSKKTRKRIGRGPASGQGKTAGKGHKGQKARSGGSIRPGFEGGQMPIYRRLPKRGFKNPFAKEYAVVNLDTLQKAVDAGKLSANSIDLLALMNAGIVSQAKDGLRLLARGAITSSINVTVNSASKAAVAAVEKAGGKVSILEVAKTESSEAKK